MSRAVDPTGRVPNDLARRLSQATPDLAARALALRVAARLEGRTPGWFKGKRLQHFAEEELQGAWPLADVEVAMDLLEGVDYGVPYAQRPTRRLRGHGSRLHERLDHVTGLLPRAYALRYPTTDDRHRTGPIDGQDVYGRVQVNHTPRDGHLGVLAGALALWKQRASGHESHVEFTGGEMAYLLRAGRRQTQRSGGGDVDWVYNLLADLATERITAQVAGDEASQAHKIPCSAIVNVERRLDGQWLTLTEYEAALAQGSVVGRTGQSATVRVTFADWVMDEIRHAERRMVFINFAVWRGLSGSGRRLYALLQGLPAARHDKRARYFYLAKPMCFTLGLLGKRRDRVHAIVSHQLDCLYWSDQRYHHKSTGERTHYTPGIHPGTTIPSFTVYANKTGSRPLPGRRVRSPIPRRSCRPAREVHALYEAYVSPADIAPEDVPRGRPGGFDRARRQVAQTRTQVVQAAARRPRAGPAP